MHTQLAAPILTFKSSEEHVYIVWPRAGQGRAGPSTVAVRGKGEKEKTERINRGEWLQA